MISCITTTYRRFYCVERIIAMWLAQTYKNKELIIFNTDYVHPFELDESLKNENIILINNNIDYKTNMPYDNTGAIRRDAVTHTNGDYFMLWDDDDLYLDFNLQQASDLIKNKAWKPQKSFFKTKGKLELVQNTLEASLLVEMKSIRKYGFRYDSGYESLSWYTNLRDIGQLNEDDSYYIPAYCFNWSDPHEIAGHKQSGDINNPNNFNNHKKNSNDYAKRPLKALNTNELNETLKPLYDFIIRNKDLFPKELYKKYIEKLD